MKNNLIKKSLIVMSVFLLSVSTSTVFAKRQVAMEKTLRALDRAERMLKKAVPNKGGHRVKALRLIRKAKEEVRLGIDFANRRDKGGSYKSKMLKGGKQNYDEKDTYQEKEKIIKKRN